MSSDPWAAIPEEERTFWWGVARKGCNAPWDTAAGPVCIVVQDAKRTPDGTVKFGVGDPDSPFWITGEGFGAEWPSDYAPGESVALNESDDS